MNTIKINKKGGIFTGTSSDDVYQITEVLSASAALVIDGGTSSLNNSGSASSPGTAGKDISTASLLATDRTLVFGYRPGSTTNINTYSTVTGTPNATDEIIFTKSGNYSNLLATNIETLSLKSGITVKISADLLTSLLNSADRGAINPGFLLQGVAGGKTEKLIVNIEFQAGFDAEESTGIVQPVAGDGYVAASLQLDDASTAALYKNVQVTYDARDPSDDDDATVSTDGDVQTSFGRYFRFDGANESVDAGESLLGCDGVDYATMRLGNDSAQGFAGNDLLIGHGGADNLDGGEGNDIFVIGGFGSGTSGTTSKADDGKAEWIISASEGLRAGVTNGISNAADYAGKFDVIKGGNGYDILRVTTGIGATSAATGTVVLNDANFIGMEKVEVGGTIAADPDESTYQRLRDGHYLFARASTVSDTAPSKGGVTGNSINNVVIDASGMTKNSLTFDGNGNAQKFIGTTKGDTLIGNGGIDTLTGGLGLDKFVFQTIREYAPDSLTANSTISYTPTDKSLTAADADVITDFSSGIDKIVFRIEETVALEDTFDSLVSLTKGNMTAGNVLIGDLIGIDTAGTATSFIKIDTTGNDATVYYDADGSGVTPAVKVATLTGVSSIAAADFVIASVQNF